jgi:hypothetical protein
MSQVADFDMSVGWASPHALNMTSTLAQQRSLTNLADGIAGAVRSSSRSPLGTGLCHPQTSEPEPERLRAKIGHLGPIAIGRFASTLKFLFQFTLTWASFGPVAGRTLLKNLGNFARETVVRE